MGAEGEKVDPVCQAGGKIILNLLLMKKLIFSLAVFVIFEGCSSVRMFADGDTGSAYDKTRGNFIELNSGEIKLAKNVVYKSPIVGKPVFVLDGGETFDAKEVIAYQVNKVYYRKYGDKYRYASRIIKGNINVFLEYVSTSEKNAGNQFYKDALYIIQKGDNGPLIALHAKALKEMVEDYKPSYDLVKGLPGYANKGKKILQAIELYNNRKM